MLDENDSNNFALRKESLRYRTTAYDSSFWNTFEKSSLYTPISENDRLSLESVTSLKSQFQYLNQPLHEVTRPVSHDSDIFKKGSSEIKDSSLYEEALKNEDSYTATILQKLSNYERDFLSHRSQIIKYNYIDILEEHKKGEFFRKQDSLGQVCYFEVITDSISSKIFNCSLERKNHKNARIMEIYFSKSYIIYLVNNKEGIGNILKVKRKGNDVLIDSIANVSEFKILNDSVLIYTRFDAIHRPSKLWSHLIGSHSTSDKLLLYEKDVEYDLELGLSSSGKYVVIDVTSQNQNEIWVMNKLMDAPSVVYKRQKGRQIQLDHFGVDAFYVASISGGMYSIVDMPIDGSPFNTRYVSGVIIANNQLVVVKYIEMEIKLLHKSGKLEKIQIPEGVNYIELIKSDQLNDSIEFMVESNVSPVKFFKLDLKTGKYVTLYEEKFTCENSKNQYVEEVVFVDGTDGVKIPVLICYDAEIMKDTAAGLLIQAYGAYGTRVYSGFDKSNIVLLQKGFVLAFPAVRGSGRVNQNWSQDGKRLNKKNTFDDFIQVTRKLKHQYQLSTNQVFAKVTSAGGLIMGVMVNEFADEFGGVILDRPFLNVSESMKDSTKYLTTIEYQEWGNPKDSLVTNYIESYSPLLNMIPELGTHLFYRGSYYDNITPISTVLKSILWYREHNPLSNLILFKIDYNEGHMVRYGAKRVAEEYAFMRYVSNL